MKKTLHVIPGILAIVVVTVGFLAINYFGNYYEGDSTAQKAMFSTDKVQVVDEKDYIFFDGPGNEKAMIMYPGGGVESEAYAPLMKGLAEAGIDCFLVRMPLHMAIFGEDRASMITENYSYDEFIMAGHSLGGSIAASYLAEHPDDFSGLILLASYSTYKIDDNIKFLSVIGSEDGILNLDKYEESKNYRPKDNSFEIEIYGGNHAGFGCYGKQDGDNDATISQKKQRSETIAAIMEYM